MKYMKVVAGLTVALAALPGVSQAQLAYAAKQVNLRAGPGMEYPVVAILLAGVPVTVQGCLADYHWCDVEAGPSRGWVYGANIVYPYQGANVPVISYGSVIGIGVLAFSVVNYWDQHYVGRPWYPQRHRWINRPPPPPHAPPVQRPAPPEQRGPTGPDHRYKLNRYRQGPKACHWPHHNSASKVRHSARRNPGRLTGGPGKKSRDLPPDEIKITPGRPGVLDRAWAYLSKVSPGSGQLSLQRHERTTHCGWRATRVHGNQGSRRQGRHGGTRSGT